MGDDAVEDDAVGGIGVEAPIDKVAEKTSALRGAEGDVAIQTDRGIDSDAGLDCHARFAVSQ